MRVELRLNWAGGGIPKATTPHNCLFFLSGLAQLFREVRIMKGLNHPNIGEMSELAQKPAVVGQGEWDCIRDAVAVAQSFLCDSGQMT